MMKKLCTCIFLLSLSLFSSAQKEASIWYFGNGAGLNFNTTCTPAVLTDGAINGNEGCATISDKNTGQLLFYTNSDSVWDRTHQAMAGGRMVSGGNTITQVGIVQKPMSSSRYYIITAEIQGFSGQGLRFHQVDMTLNGGLGDFSFKDSILFPTPVTEKIAMIRHSNGTDVWIVAHEYNSNQFLTFLITPTGISTTPVISTIGKVHYSSSAVDPIGELKASPDGSKLALVSLYTPNIELLDFNKTTGVISNLITLPENGGYDGIGNSSCLYGISFSPNNRFLYVSSWKIPLMTPPVPGRIIQYNISSNDSAIIQASRVNIVTSYSRSFYSLQLGPDRRIYVGDHENHYLSVIENPDSSGLACNYSDSAIYLGGKISSWGLNNVLSYTTCSEKPSNVTTATDENAFSIWPNPANSFLNIESTGSWSIQVIDMEGKSMFTHEITGNSHHTIDISLLKPGIYAVTLMNENNRLVKKLVIK